MKPLKKILVPTDLTVASLEALRYAQDLADPFSTDIILLHTLHRDEERRVTRFQSDPAELDARKKLIHLLTREGLIRRDLRIMLANRSPLTAVLEAIEKLSIDLVVMTTRGRTGFNHALVGSVAEQVVRLSPVPVLVVKIPGQEQARLCENDIQTHLSLN
jgi:nucleotide-binding universal stress UspA family protein